MSMTKEMFSKIEKNLNESTHFHSEIELVFVIQGNTRVTIRDKVHDLEKNDILLINSGLSHSMSRTDHKFDCVCCVVRYSSGLISDILKKEKFLFACDSVNDKTRSYDKIKDTFTELVYHYANSSDKMDCLKKSLLYKLLNILIEHHLLEDTVNLSANSDDERLRQIIQYVDKNFRYNISLSELSDSMFVSKSTLSRFFNKQTGLHFADYVNKVRIQNAVSDLMYSEKNITQAALDSGFSNISVFNQVFRKIYGISPSEYREKERENMNKKEAEENKALEQVYAQILKENSLNKNTENNTVTISADASGGEEYDKFWNKCVNVGALDSLLLANIQYHVLYLSKNIGFKYMRFWNVFSEKMTVTDGKHIGNYSYSQLDMALDFFVQNHIKPFLDFGLRPDTAVINGRLTLYFKDAGIQFDSKEAWQAMVKDFTSHIITRYGAKEVSKWIFEFSSDPVHLRECQCYKDNNYSHSEAFKFFYEVLKQAVPDAIVGGPMAIHNWNSDFVYDFMRFCVKNNCVPDFVSFLLFPYETVVKGDYISSERSTKRDYEKQAVLRMREIIGETDSGSKLFITEWNNSLSNRSYINDSCFRAAYMAKCINDCWGKVDMMNVWMASDWISNYFDTSAIANGGSGLLTKSTIEKPAYFLMSLMNRLGDFLIDKGDGYIITRTKQNSFYIICYNYKWYSCDFFFESENFLTPDYIKGMFENENQITVNISLNNVQDGKYTIKRRSIDPDEGNILNEWKAFQYENDLTGADIKYIRQACYPRIKIERRQTENNRLNFSLTLKPHEVIMLHIYNHDN